MTHLGERMLLIVLRYGFTERELDVHKMLTSPAALAAGVPELQPIENVTYVRVDHSSKSRLA